MWGEEMIPQVKVMPYVDMVILHGGNNGIIEAFYYGKPMIVMPLCNDHFDNAQRIDEKGFGIRMDPNNCTQHQLINSIDNILNDKELAKRMKMISQRIHNENNGDKFANLIESLI